MIWKFSVAKGMFSNKIFLTKGIRSKPEPHTPAKVTLWPLEIGCLPACGSLQYIHALISTTVYLKHRLSQGIGEQSHSTDDYRYDCLVMF